MLWTGYQAIEGNATIIKIFENTDVTKSLLLGGPFGLIVTLVMFFRQAFVLRGVKQMYLQKVLMELSPCFLLSIFCCLHGHCEI